MYIYVYVYTYMCINICTYTYMYILKYRHINTSTFSYVCRPLLPIYIYVFDYMYIHIFIGKVVFICLRVSVNLVYKFQGKSGTTTVKHDLNPNGLKFHRGSP